MTTWHKPLPAAGLQGRRGAWAEAALVAALSFAWLVATAWCRPLMLPDEGRYVGVAWEMMRSGDWLTPMLNGLPFFHKPPLFYWLTASAMSVLGAGAWSARTASVLGATLGAVALFLFTRRWQGRQAAFVTLGVLLVQPLWYVGGQFANLDMLVAGCITACTLALAHAALRLEAGLPVRRALLLAYGLAGLGLLAKGLIGFVLPGLIVVVWLVLRQRWRLILGLLSLPGLLLMLAIAAPWFWAMAQRHESFLHYFFVVQHFQRFAGSGFNNAQPFWFYPVVLAVLSLPWLLWLRAPVRQRLPADPQDIGLLMLCAIGVVLLFFSLPQSKLVGYILPCVPPLAWWVARCLPGPQAPPRWQWALRASVLLSLALNFTAVGVLALDKGHTTRELGLALRSLHRAGEPVVMLGQYAYDVPFYARLTEPVWVADDWQDPAVHRRDSWRKELAEASDFASPAAAAHLLQPAEVPPLVCRSGMAWVITDTPRPGGTPLPAWLDGATAVFTGARQTLWRLDAARLASALGCGQRPSAGPAGRSAPPSTPAPAPATPHSAGAPAATAAHS